MTTIAKVAKKMTNKGGYGLSDTVARAFELAKSGNYRELTELEKILGNEGYDDVYCHFRGQLLRKQLVTLMKGALSANSAQPIQTR